MTGITIQAPGAGQPRYAVALGWPFGSLAPRAVVIHNGIDTDEFRSLGRHEFPYADIVSLLRRAAKGSRWRCSSPTAKPAGGAAERGWRSA